MDAPAPSHFGEIADAMRQLKPDAGAVLFYELMSDALAWSDEIPEMESQQVRAFRPLRFLLRYRTSLILGQPDQRYQEYWDEALTLFPEWPGFEPRRRAAELRQSYDQFRAQASADIKELFKEKP
jgi:hypothetical protein